MSFVLHAIQSLLCFIDECIYNVASMIYSLLIYIAESNIFDQNVIQGFATRIYALLGIFMLFKISFSLINYIVNPDDFTKGEKGINKLIPNVMITLVLIVFTPRIFEEAMDLQHFITSQHFFEKIILSNSYDETIKEGIGDELAAELFGAFYYYEGTPPADTEGMLDQLPGTNISYYTSLTWAFSGASEYNAYNGIWKDTSTYHAVISTAAGIILILVLIQFCFDIAIRTVQFGFLQLISPIPIISRIDPKSAKSGLFSKWLKQCIQTYADLFIRLIALYFAIYIIQIITHTEFQVPDSSDFTTLIVKVMLILGTLLFAKQLPKFLKELGFNLNNGFTLNPMKRLREVPGMNRVGGALGNMWQRGIGTYQQQTAMGTNRGRAILRSLGHGAAGIPGGVIAGRGFRGQMAAVKTAQTDLYDAAAKLRMQNPKLTEEEALRLAQRDMRGDRIKGAIGLQTSQDELHRMETELGIQKRAHEKAKNDEFKQRDEQLRLSKEAIEERERVLKNREIDRENRKLIPKQRQEAIANITKAADELYSIGKANLEDDSKGTLLNKELRRKEMEITAKKQRLEEAQKVYEQANGSNADFVSTSQYKQMYSDIVESQKSLENWKKAASGTDVDSNLHRSNMMKNDSKYNTKEEEIDNASNNMSKFDALVEREKYVSQKINKAEEARLKKVLNEQQAKINDLTSSGASDEEISAAQTVYDTLDKKYQEYVSNPDKATLYQEYAEQYREQYKNAEDALQNQNLSAEQRKEYESQRDSAVKAMNQIIKDSRDIDIKMVQKNEDFKQSVKIYGEQSGEAALKYASVTSEGRYTTNKQMTTTVLGEINRSISAIDSEALADFEEKHSIEEAKRRNEETSRIISEDKAADQRYKEKVFDDVEKAQQRARAAVDAEHKANESRRNESHNNNGGGRH